MSYMFWILWLAAMLLGFESNNPYCFLAGCAVCAVGSALHGIEKKAGPQ